MKFPVDAPRSRVVGSLEALGFQIVRQREHISMRRTNVDGTITPLVRSRAKMVADHADVGSIDLMENTMALVRVIAGLSCPIGRNVHGGFQVIRAQVSRQARCSQHEGQ
jgi:predicted RNA binding protein YcfA (HicA-like mRNA interferase family)